MNVISRCENLWFNFLFSNKFITSTYPVYNYTRCIFKYRTKIFITIKIKVLQMQLFFFGT
jgi:hypothetical protein